jgi:hypothetical protein
MPLLKVQLNHPGAQKRFKLGKDYFFLNNRIIREWNSDGNHYRKFIQNKGFYLSSLDIQPNEADLFFWGEWEGYSTFSTLMNNDLRIYPNGIHKPFHSILNRKSQNTDPYIYGDFFKYATCKQTGQLCNLYPSSLILFGSTYPELNAFYLDTVFVVKSGDPATNVCKTSASDYSLVYKEETLERLLNRSGNEYLGPHPSPTKKLYHGQSWWDNQNYFSFVPSRINNDHGGFERLKIALDNPVLNLSRYQSGKSYLANCQLSPEGVWKEIVKISFEQKYLLGIRFEEPANGDHYLDKEQ